MQPEILFDVRNHIGFVTLNRPAALNSLTLLMVQDLAAQLEDWASDRSIYAVLVRGSGDKAFCAGGDIRALYQSITTAGTMHEKFFAEEYRLDYRIHRYPKPYLALMNGITLGGGMGISQGAALRIVGDSTRMAMPETGIGLFPDVGASLTGNQIRAADALALRLADVYLRPAAIAGLEGALSSMRWSSDPVADVENLMRSAGVQDVQGATLPALRPAIDEHFSKPDVRDIIASLAAEMRPEYRDWAQSTLATLQRRSPLMLAVTARQLGKAAKMSLADCFRMELAMMHQSCKEHDFIEGVRALIIDKDNAPRWQPERLEDVSEEMIAPFFRSPWSASGHPLGGLEK